MCIESVTISVLVCTHNRCELLKRTLQSLYQVTRPAQLRWEVIVVDNNSGDSTKAVVAAFAQQDASLPIKYVFEPRKGIAFARNAGVEKASGKVVAFVDDDVRVEPRWLSVIADAFQADPELAVLGGRLTAEPETSMPRWIAEINQAPLGLVDFGSSRKLLTIPYLATGNCVFKRRAIVDAGMFDVRLGRRPDKLYADEDTDMIARIQRAHGKVIYEPALSALHWIPSARMSKSYFRRWYLERGEGFGLVGSTQRRALLGVPLYEFRHLFTALVKYVASLASGMSAFQQELEIRHFIGIVIGRIKTLSRRP